MKRLAALCSRLWEDRRGVTALEYGLLSVVLLTIIITAFNLLSSTLAAEFNAIGNRLSGT